MTQPSRDPLFRRICRRLGRSHDEPRTASLRIVTSVDDADQLVLVIVNDGPEMAIGLSITIGLGGPGTTPTTEKIVTPEVLGIGEEWTVHVVDDCDSDADWTFWISWVDGDGFRAETLTVPSSRSGLSTLNSDRDDVSDHDETEA